MFCPYGFGFFFVRYVFLPNTVMSGCKPSTYRSILVFDGYIQIWLEIWQYLWPDLGTRSRLPICSISGWNSSFGDCRRMSEPGVVKGIVTTLHNQKPKYAIGKKKSVTSKTHNGQKNVHTVFQVYIYTCVFNNVDFRIASSALVSALSRSPGGAGARERRRIASQTHQCRGHGCSWCEKISKIDDNHGNYCDKFHI